MLSDDHKQIKLGVLTGPKVDTSILQLLLFIEKELPLFSKKYKGKSIQNENGLTQKLCAIFNLKAKNEEYPFWFSQEFMEMPESGKSPRVDISTNTSLEKGVEINSRTYHYDESFFSLEAKRLDCINKVREKEYVIGHMEKKKYINSGGIERFKNGTHGGNNKYAGLIGYVQKNNFNYWQKLINSWVERLIRKKIKSSVCWSNQDKLVRKSFCATNAKYISNNLRDKDSIRLFHFWVSI